MEYVFLSIIVAIPATIKKAAMNTESFLQLANKRRLHMRFPPYEYDGVLGLCHIEFDGETEETSFPRKRESRQKTVRDERQRPLRPLFLSVSISVSVLSTLDASLRWHDGP
jgi:hypothetical protein